MTVDELTQEENDLKNESYGNQIDQDEEVFENAKKRDLNSITSTYEQLRKEVIKRHLEASKSERAHRREAKAMIYDMITILKNIEGLKQNDITNRLTKDFDPIYKRPTIKKLVGEMFEYWKEKLEAEADPEAAAQKAEQKKKQLVTVGNNGEQMLEDPQDGDDEGNLGKARKTASMVTPVPPTIRAGKKTKEDVPITGMESINGDDDEDQEQDARQNYVIEISEIADLEKIGNILQTRKTLRIIISPDYEFVGTEAGRKLNSND